MQFKMPCQFYKQTSLGAMNFLSPQELCCVLIPIRFSKELFKQILMHPRKEVETLFTCKVTALIVYLFDEESMHFCCHDRKQ